MSRYPDLRLNPKECVCQEMGTTDPSIFWALLFKGGFYGVKKREVGEKVFSLFFHSLSSEQQSNYER